MSYNYPPLCQAVMDNNILLILKLIQNDTNINETTYTHKTPLYLAAYNNNISVVKILIRHGTKIHYQKCINNSPLYAAIYNKNFEILKLLLSYKHKYIISKSNMKKLLLLTKTQNNIKCFALLLIYGFIPHIDTIKISRTKHNKNLISAILELFDNKYISKNKHINNLKKIINYFYNDIGEFEHIKLIIKTISNFIEINKYQEYINNLEIKMLEKHKCYKLISAKSTENLINPSMNEFLFSYYSSIIINSIDTNNIKTMAIIVLLNLYYRYNKHSVWNDIHII